MMSGRLYVGIDLGTFQSTIASSAGAMHSVETVVGRPKDPVARNFLKRDVLFGADALKNKLACNLYRPMAAGVAQDDEANLAAAKAFVSHLIETVDPEEFDEASASSVLQATFPSPTRAILLQHFVVKSMPSWSLQNHSLLRLPSMKLVVPLLSLIHI